jgi:hypothetical protein
MVCFHLYDFKSLGTCVSLFLRWLGGWVLVSGGVHIFSCSFRASWFLGTAVLTLYFCCSQKASTRRLLLLRTTNLSRLLNNESVVCEQAKYTTVLESHPTTTTRSWNIACSFGIKKDSRDVVENHPMPLVLSEINNDD